MLEIRSEMHGGPMDKPANPSVRTRPGRTAVIEVGNAPNGETSGNHAIKIEMTPSVGC